MKKLVVTILALLYITASIGATVHLHYCMDKLVDWGLGHNDKEKCSNCGMKKIEEKENGCCKDEHKQVKLENDHKGAAIYQLSELSFAVLPIPVFEQSYINVSTITEQNPLSHAPPRSGELAVYIRNCIFRI